MIDPEIPFGRPVLAGSGIPTLVIAERYKAGESIAEIARDNDRPEAEIEAAGGLARRGLPAGEAA